MKNIEDVLNNWKDIDQYQILKIIRYVKKINTWFKWKNNNLISNLISILNIY